MSAGAAASPIARSWRWLRNPVFWMPVAEYFASHLVSTFNKRIVRAALSSAGVAPEWIDGYADPARYEFFMPSSSTETEGQGYPPEQRP